VRSDADIAILRHCLSKTRVRWIQFDGRFFLEDSAIANALTQDEVERAADRQIAVLNSAVQLKCGHFEKLDLRCIIEFQERGTSRAGVGIIRRVLSQRAAYEVRAFLDNDQSNIDEILNASDADEEFGNALHFLNRGENPWTDLYKCFEVIRSANGGEDKLTEPGWCSKRQLKRFRWTANHPLASGKQARHARLGTAAPTDPMSIEQAHEFILELLRYWGKNISKATTAHLR